MKATIVDLRYRMNDVLKALGRNEVVSVMCHGKVKGVLKPCATVAGGKVTDHPYFRMRPSAGSVEKEMDRLRGGRHRDL
ncbi:MAG: type II toxin-antitoxin system Phd/YefM family antitoxin [Chlamydiota bacterium]